MWTLGLIWSQQPLKLLIRGPLNQFAGPAGWWEEQVGSTNNGVFLKHGLSPA